MASAARPKMVMSKTRAGREAPDARARRALLSGAAGDALERGDEIGGLGGEWFVFVEKGIDHVGRDEDAEQKERQRDDPKIEPPTARALAYDGIENPGEQGADDDGQELGFGPIGSPGGPGLNGDFVKLGNRFLKKFNGKL